MARRNFARLFALAAAALAGQACDNTTCRTLTTALSASCIPDAIDVDRDVRIEVRELCGRNCARFPACTATLSNGALVLDVHEDQCNDVPTVACSTAPCQQRVVGCRLPPLPQGDYALQAPGLSDQLVRVRPGGAAACQLIVPNPDGGV